MLEHYYECDCLTGVRHRHALPAARARARGVHPGAPPAPPAPAGVEGDVDGVEDAVRGALWGLLIGDALAHPLHWYYTWPVTVAHKAEHYGGGIRGYAAPAPGAAHPDSHKYFQRCVPAQEPVPAIFEGDGGRGGPAPPQLWATPGTNYHATVPAGDNTLTARLAALVGESLLQDDGFDAEAYFRRYVALLAGREAGPPLAAAWLAQGGGDAAAASGCAATAAAAAAAAATAAAANPRGLTSGNLDTWVDESHRVLVRNLSRAGAAPWEAGMDDCCLTGIALCVPLLLAYAGNRDAQELAVRALLQLTHKSEDMVRQVLWFGDALGWLLAARRDAPGAAAASGGLLHAVCSSYSDGKLELAEVLQRFRAGRPGDSEAVAVDPSADDAAAFHGGAVDGVPQAAVFSVR